jgi:putative membrane protein
VVRWAFAALHLIALGIGLGAVWARAQMLGAEPPDLKRAFVADTWWGIAAILWIATGLVRLLAGLEKATGYYVSNTFFRIKMTLLIIILILEIAPMINLIRWRIRLGRGEQPDTHLAKRFSLISRIQAGLVLLMVLAATAMARGYGSK